MQGSKLFNKLALGGLLSMACAGAAYATAVAPQYGTFTAATVDVFDNSATAGTSFDFSQIGASIVVERGPSTSGAYGKARAELGSNGFMANSGAAGFSAWADGFVINGGTGAGQLDISVDLHGTMTGNEPDMFYGLYLSSTPFTVDPVNGLNDTNLNTAVLGSTSLLSYAINNNSSPTNALLTGKLNFTYGQTFYLLSVFGGDVCTPLEPGQGRCAGGSTEDFYHSAHFGITAASANSIATVSGYTYAPAAVPEPQAWLLVGFGALVMAMVRRRSA